MATSDDFLEWFTGVKEAELLQHREQFLQGDAIVNVRTKNKWRVGMFTTPLIKELEVAVQRMPDVRGDDPSNRIGIDVEEGKDIAQEQAKLRTESAAMIQVTSNFNCLPQETHKHIQDATTNDCASIVSEYANDMRQASSASFGVTAAALYRAHFVFRHVEPQQPSEWGQTRGKQVGLLKDVAQYFGVCHDGTLRTVGSWTPSMGVQNPKQVEDHLTAVSKDIRVGVHTDCEVIFGRGSGRYAAYSPPGAGTRGPAAEVAPLRLVDANPFPCVDQVLVGTVDWRILSFSEENRSAAEDQTRTLLRAAYSGAYLAAILRRRRMLILTMVGGGNGPEHADNMILEEMARAHAQFAHHPKSLLTKVRLLLPESGDKDVIVQNLQGYIHMYWVQLGNNIHDAPGFVQALKQSLQMQPTTQVQHMQQTHHNPMQPNGDWHHEYGHGPPGY